MFSMVNRCARVRATQNKEKGRDKAPHDLSRHHGKLVCFSGILAAGG
jgi:hypothetical protein